MGGENLQFVATWKNFILKKKENLFIFCYYYIFFSFVPLPGHIDTLFQSNQVAAILIRIEKKNIYNIKTNNSSSQRPQATHCKGIYVYMKCMFLFISIGWYSYKFLSVTNGDSYIFLFFKIHVWFLFWKMIGKLRAVLDRVQLWVLGVRYMVDIFFIIILFYFYFMTFSWVNNSCMIYIF